MGQMQTSNIQDNEIIKAVDINDTFDAQITNVAKALQCLLETNKDFVLAPDNLLTQHSDNPNDWTINLAPLFSICKDTGIPVLETEDNPGLISINPASEFDRIDTVEIRGVYQDYDIEQRAFIDFDTNEKTLGMVYTKRKLVIETNVLTNSVFSVSAPNHTEGWIKIAEVVVPSTATRIADCTINNITSDVATVENSNWTNEKSATYNVHYMSEINRRFRVEHNADGSHKSNVILATNIKIGNDNDALNGNIVPLGNQTTVSGEGISSDKTIFEAISKLAEKINDLYNEYLQAGVYKFNKEIEIGGDAEHTYSGNRIKIGFNQDGSGYIKLGNTEILSILSNGIFRVKSGYNPTNKRDIVTKAQTDDLQDEIDSIDLRVNELESTNDKTVYTNNVLSRYSIVQISIRVATISNIQLSNTQTIDGIILNVGDYVLVKNQNNTKENGLYQVQAADWIRIETYNSPNSIKEKIFIVNNGTVNAGKMFYCPKVNFINPETFGTDEIPFSEYFGSIQKLPNKVAVRDNGGRLKTAASVSGDDCINRDDLLSGNLKTAILDMVYPIGSLYWSSKATEPGTLFGGTWERVTDKFIFAAGTKQNGTTGGEESVVLTAQQLPSHNHKITHTHTYTPSGTITSTFSGNQNTTSNSSINITSKEFDTTENQADINISGKSTSSTDLYIRQGDSGKTSGMSKNSTGNFTMCAAQQSNNPIRDYGGFVTRDTNSVEKSGIDWITFGASRTRYRVNMNVEHTHTLPSLSVSASSSKDEAHKHTFDVIGKTDNHSHKVTISFDSVGSHNHTITPSGTVTSSFSGASTSISGLNTEYSDNTGINGSHNNMPPYLVRYCWERIS